MSDNITTSPFDEIITQMEAVEREEAAKDAAKAKAASAMLVAGLAKQAKDRSDAERKAVAASRRDLAAVFVVEFQTKVVAVGKRHGWSKQDFVKARTLTEYLTSAGDTKLTVVVSQSVKDVVHGIFAQMLKDQRRLSRDETLPPRYFQGGRDILNKRPRRDGQHLGSQSRLSSPVGGSMPAHLRPAGWQPPKGEDGNVVFIDRRGKKQSVKHEAS